MTASTELLEQLHALVGEKLKAAIASGEAPASIFAQAIKFLSDNNVTSVGNKTVGQLASMLEEKLPFTNPNDPTAHTH